MKKEIGGFFELELAKRKPYHDYPAFNTARNALYAYLQCTKPNRVFLPEYTCPAVLEPITKSGIPFSFYPVNEVLSPLFDYMSLEDSHLFIVNNYFGLPISDTISFPQGVTVLEDNAQAFFKKPKKNHNAIYSARKFFGVGDGAYLYTTKHVDLPSERESSDIGLKHLLGRIVKDASSFYNEYSNTEKVYQYLKPKQISIFSERVLMSIDYDESAKRRVSNFCKLHSSLGSTNDLTPLLENYNGYVPMSYPYLCGNHKLREHLIKNNVYIPTFWIGIDAYLLRSDGNKVDVKNILPLPIDQRYCEDEMKRLVLLIQSYGT